MTIILFGGPLVPVVSPSVKPYGQGLVGIEGIGRLTDIQDRSIPGEERPGRVVGAQRRSVTGITSGGGRKVGRE